MFLCMRFHIKPLCLRSMQISIVLIYSCFNDYFSCYKHKFNAFFIFTGSKNSKMLLHMVMTIESHVNHSIQLKMFVQFLWNIHVFAADAKIKQEKLFQFYENQIIRDEQKIISNNNMRVEQQQKNGKKTKLTRTKERYLKRNQMRLRREKIFTFALSVFMAFFCLWLNWVWAAFLVIHSYRLCIIFSHSSV